MIKKQLSVKLHDINCNYPSNLENAVFCGWIVIDEGEKEFQVWGAVLQRMELRR